MVRNIENGVVLIEKWLRNKNTIEFLGIWEELYNEQFDYDEYCSIMQEAGLNRFAMSVKQWVERTNSRGIVAKAGRYGGTYAYKDIALEFASWVSPKFKLYLIKEFERLKKEEEKQIGWNAKRELAKINDRIHTDAIKEKLIPRQVTKQQTAIMYASEADVLNVALFRVSIWDDDQIIAMARMNGDMGLNYYIKDVVVRPEYQHKGIGRMLINELQKFINDNGVKGTEIFVELCAAPDKIPFYEKFGFEANEAQRLRIFHRVN